MTRTLYSFLDFLQEGRVTMNIGNVNGTEQLSIGTNSIIFFNSIAGTSAGAALIYDGDSHRLVMRGLAKPVDFFLDGSLITGSITDGTLTNLITKVHDLQTKVSELEVKLAEVYYAPGMPGYVNSQESFADALASINNITVKEDTQEESAEMKEQSLPYITAIAAINSDYGIGLNGGIPWKIPEDLEFFKKQTTESISGKPNVVIMGRKTWESLPKKPLPDRINVVLSKNPLPDSCFGARTRDLHDKVINLQSVDSVLVWLQTNRKIYENVFIIGGSQVYKDFLPYCQEVILTEIKNGFECDVYFPDEFLDNGDFEEVSVEDVHSKSPFFITRSFYRRDLPHHDFPYCGLVEYIRDNGTIRQDRTGTGTVSVFCPNKLEFDVSERVPLLTVKSVPARMVIEELLFFLRGDTDAKILQRKGIHIWDGNSSREFLDNRGLQHYPEGVLGPVYSWQWRHAGAPYDPKCADTTKLTPDERSAIGGVDQIEEIIHLLKTDPFSRRIILDAWNPSDLEKMALPPCHMYCQFYVEGDQPENQQLSLHVHMRSCDVFLGLPFNIFSYTCLLYIIAKKVSMKPKYLHMTLGDAHLYQNHLEQASLLLKRKPFSSPKLELSDAVVEKDFHDITVDDFEITEYHSHGKLLAKMAI